MRILVAEDKADIISSYKETISTLVSEGVDIECIYADDLTGALDIIDKQKFDGAVIDLKLSSADSDGEGNNVIKKIVNNKTFPVFVYSAYTGDLDDSIEQSFFFQVFDKTSITFLEIVKKNLEIFKTGITEILGKDGEIEKNLIEIFWKHSPKPFEKLMSKGINKQKLMRFIVGHLYEYLTVDDANAFDSYMPEEVYIAPPIKSTIFTGSIIESVVGDVGKKYIVLTPACDLANTKTDKLVLASVDQFSDHRNLNEIKTKAQGSSKDKKSAKSELGKVINNNYDNKLYFLPNSENFSGGFINFQDLRVVDYPGTTSSDFSVVATVNNYFLKDIISKFTSYYSRQGAPSLKYSFDDIS